MQGHAIHTRRSPPTVSLVEDLAGAAAAGPRPRISVVRSGALGDTILLLPSLLLLRTCIPRVALTLIGSAWAESLRPLWPFALPTIRLDTRTLTLLFGPPPAQDPTELFAAADATILYTATPNSPFVRNVIASCRGPVLVWSSLPAEGTHAALHLARGIVRAPVALQDLPCPALHPPNTLKGWAHGWLAARFGPGERPVALHPGSGGRHKQWPPEGFSAVARELATPILLLEGAADTDACRQVASRMPSTQPMARAAGLSLPEVAALLQACRVYIGNDSGVSHLAAAVGVPTVAVLGPTDATVWAPLGPRVVVVCPAAGAAWPRPDAVLEAVRKVETG